MGSYYIILASQICKCLGALNSDVYFRCQRANCWIENISNSNVSRDLDETDFVTSDTNAAVLEVYEQIQQQKCSNFAYSEPRRVHKLLFTILDALQQILYGVSIHRAKRSGSAELRTQSRDSNMRLLLSFLDQEMNDDSHVNSPVDDAYSDTETAAGLGEVKQERRKSTDSATEETWFLRGAKRKREEGACEQRLPPTKYISSIVSQLEENISKIEAELDELFFPERPFVSREVYTIFKLFVLGSRIHCKWWLGNIAETLQAILAFMEVFRSNSSNVMLFSCKVVIERILYILQRTSSVELTKQFLILLAPLASASPSIEQLQRRYADGITLFLKSGSSNNRESGH